jgi:hypothetical protein
VPPTPSTVAENLNANVRALFVLSGDFCGSNCAAVASVPISYKGGQSPSTKIQNLHHHRPKTLNSKP